MKCDCRAPEEQTLEPIWESRKTHADMRRCAGGDRLRWRLRGASLTRGLPAIGERLRLSAGGAAARDTPEKRQGRLRTGRGAPGSDGHVRTSAVSAPRIPTLLVCAPPEPETHSHGYTCLCAPVAQLDRALGFEPRGWGFKSLRARQRVTSGIARDPKSRSAAKGGQAHAVRKRQLALEHGVSLGLRANRTTGIVPKPQRGAR